jgi:hypothetical protein
MQRLFYLYNSLFYVFVVLGIILFLPYKIWCLAGFALFAVLLGTCNLGFQWYIAHRRFERSTKRAAIYRKFGEEPPPPSTRWSMFRTMLSFTPVLLIFALLNILNIIFFILQIILYLPYKCFLAGKKPDGGSPQPPS